MMLIFSFLKVFTITLVISSVYELLALNTPINFTFCKYRYNLNKSLFKVNFLGLPLIVPFLQAIALVLIPNYFGFIFLDLFVELVANEKKWWTWERKGLYYGTPLTNFVAWTILWLTVEGILKWL